MSKALDIPLIDRLKQAKSTSNSAEIVAPKFNSILHHTEKVRKNDSDKNDEQSDSDNEDAAIQLKKKSKHAPAVMKSNRPVSR